MPLPRHAVLGRSLLVLTVVAAAAAGCIEYAPVPIDSKEVVLRQSTRQIDGVAVEAALSRIAPDYAWTDGRWNRLTLLAAAIATNPELARARAAVDAARAEAAAARISPGPTLTLTAEYAFNPTEPSSWLYGIASDWLIDRGGRRRGRIERADVAAEIALLGYADAVWTIRANLRRALDARLTWQAEASLAHDLVAMRQREFEAVSRRVAAGEVSRLELDRVRADAADAARTEAAARGNAVGAGLDLAAALGLSIDGIDLDTIEPGEPVIPDNAITLSDEQLSAALSGRSDILRAMVAYDEAEASLRVAVASQYPELRIGPGYTWERGLKKLPFTLSLTLPTSDRARSTIRAAEARRAEAGRQVEAAVAGVTAGITRARADYRAAWNVLRLVRSRTLPTADALARQADLELEAGSINRAEWAASQAGLMTAKIDRLVAVRGVLEAEATLEDALRQPLRGPETVLGSSLAHPDVTESGP